jgi:hypothetical protein
MYSASVVESATIGCFFELHEIAPPSIVKTYPDMEWRAGIAQEVRIYLQKEY